MATKQAPDTVRLVDIRGVTVTVAADKADARIAGGYKTAKGSKAAAPVDDSYNPGANNVADVVAYLNEADDDERARVIDAEQAGKARAGIVGWEPTPADPNDA